MQTNFDVDLSDYFTDVEDLRDAFKASVAEPMPTKRLFVIHGVGGAGKSSLLQMFRLHCKGVHVPVALASGDEAKSALDVLYRKTETGEDRGWVSDLKVDGVRFPKFDVSYEHYRAIQAKVDEQAKKAQDARGRMANIAGKAASKTAEAASGALAGAAIGSIIPGIGTAIGGALGGVLGGMGAEALVDWLRGFLKQPDIDLLLDPTKKLTDDFLADVAPAADKRRIVLLLDTFEQMTALDDWAREVAQRLPANALFVIAGRALPNWSRAWPSWMANAQVEELKPMTEDNMRELVRRYYATMRGGEPNPAQVEAIIRFARGLPMVVTSAVQLWVKYGVEDFQAVKPEIVANLVDRLMEGVPNALIPALEAAASVRWFDQPILRAVTGLADVRDVYNELRRFPFVRVRVEGLALHNAVREMIDENLRAHDSERYCELHERAAVYFEVLIKRLKGIPSLNEEWQRLTIEEVYHLLRVDEETGMELSHKSFEQGFAYFRYQFCQTLLDDAESLPLRSPKGLHRLKFNHIRLKIAEFSPAYVTPEEFAEVVAQSDRDPLNKWEVYLSYAGFLGFTTAQWELEAEYIKKSFEALQAIGQEESVAGCFVLQELARIYYEEPVKREAVAKRAIDISQKIGQPYYVYGAYVQLGNTYMDQGNLQDSEVAFRAALKIAENHQDNARIADALNRLGGVQTLSGKLSEAEETLIAALNVANWLPETLGAGLNKAMYIKRHLGILYHMRGEYDKAIKYYSESVQTYRQRRSTGGRLRTLIYLALCLYEAGRINQIKDLSPDIEELVAKVKNSEMVASWLTLQGHILLDDLSSNPNLIHDVVAKYGEALTIALENRIIVLDKILSRILWQTGLLVQTQSENVAREVIKGLIVFWNNGQMADVQLTTLESEKRKAFLGEDSKAEKESLTLRRLENALIQSSQVNEKPSPWLTH